MKDSEGITCNCGVIKGGTIANTVPDECEFITDIRFASKEQYETACKQIINITEKTFVKGCSSKSEIISFRPAMPLTQRNEALLDKMNEIYETVGLPILEKRFSFSGSDAAYITEAQIPCVDNVGIVGGLIHSQNEFAYINSLKETAKRLAVVALYI